MQLDRVSWLEMKDFVNARNLSIQVLATTEEYKLAAVDTFFAVEHIMDRNPSDTTDLLDFETNYLPNANGQIGLQTFNQDRRLLVDTDFSNPASALGAPVYTQKLRTDWDNTKVDLNMLSQGYNTIYMHNGNGKLDSFTLRFNSDNIRARLTIDSTEVIFDITGEFLEDFSGEDKSNCKALYWDNYDEKNLIFNPRYPLLYTSQVKIEAVANGESSKRDMEGYMIMLTKEV